MLRAKDDLLSEEGQSLNSIFADCFSDWFISISLVEDDVVAKCISKLHQVRKRCKFRPKIYKNAHFRGSAQLSSPAEGVN